MSNKQKILWITRTAILLALLLVLQTVSKPLGQLVTGSLVNMVLVVAVMVAGLASGLTVAIVSPLLATLLGISAMWVLVPFIALGNVVLVLLWYFIGNRKKGKTAVNYGIAWVTAAVAKFVVLFVCVAQIAVPLILQLPEPKASVVSGMFSFPQLFTALIGGAVAMLIIPVLKKAVNK
ncbi:MAG: ECF transporter S component [Eubacteriales bacterium]